MLLDTSLDAWNSVRQTLGVRQRAVLDVIKYLKDPTNSEISQYIGLPINCVTPRVNELRSKGLVGDGGKRICKVTGKEVHCWRAK